MPFPCQHSESSCRCSNEEALLRAKARQEENRKLCGRKDCKKYRDYICVDDLGNLVAPNYITQKFKETLLRSNMRPIRFHDLHHSCASLLIKNKIPMKQVQLWLGHSSFATTANSYAHLDIESKQDAADMIASRLSLPGGKKKAVPKTRKKAATGKNIPQKKPGPAEFSVKISGFFHDSKSVSTARGRLFGRQLGRHLPLMSAKKGRSGRQKSKKRTPKLTFQRSIYGVVPVVGVEPTRCRQQRILSPSRLPIPTHRPMELFYYTICSDKNQVR